MTHVNAAALAKRVLLPSSLSILIFQANLFFSTDWSAERLALEKFQAGENFGVEPAAFPTLY